MWWEIVSSLISVLLHTVGVSPIHIGHEASWCSLHHEVDITKELLVTCVQRYKAQPARGGGGCDMCLAYGGVRYKCVNISSIAVCWSDNTPYTVAGLSLADMNMIIITCPSPLTAPALLALTHWTDLRPDSLLGSKCETLWILSECI